MKSKPMTIAKPPTKDDIEKTLNNASKDNSQLAIVVLNNTSENVYDYVKQCSSNPLSKRHFKQDRDFKVLHFLDIPALQYHNLF